MVDNSWPSTYTACINKAQHTLHRCTGIVVRTWLYKLIYIVWACTVLTPILFLTFIVLTMLY